MKHRVRFLIVLGLISMLAAACAKPVALEPLPTHPFPRWVSGLETGRTDIDEVLERFGPPDEVEESVRGGTIWRYAYSEIDWPEDDPMRPVVAADGTVTPRETSAFERGADGFRIAGRWIDRAFFFPPRQTRPPRSRRLPATIHHLELVFKVDGKLRRYRYTPMQGVAKVRVKS